MGTSPTSSNDTNWQRNRTNQRTIQFRANENIRLVGTKKFVRKTTSNGALEEEDQNNKNFETKMTTD